MLPNRVLPTAKDLACWVTRLEDENLFHPFSLKDDDIPSLRRCREITCQLLTCTSKRCATLARVSTPEIVEKVVNTNLQTITKNLSRLCLHGIPFARIFLKHTSEFSSI